MSREHCPKQLLPLVGERSLLQETLSRVADDSRFTAPIVVTNESLRFVVAEQLRAIGRTPLGLLLEPVGRNTAPALAAAALFAHQADPDAVLLALPSDHAVRDVPALIGLVDAARDAAQEGALVTFGIVPVRAETGYGYIRRGAPWPGREGLFKVAAFVEKPDADRADALVRSGDYTWNSGMFLFTARHFLAELEAHAPEVLASVRRAVALSAADQDFTRLDAAAFAAAPSISVDFAVMEHTANAATIPCEIGWSDLGTWSELWTVAGKDAAGNAVHGDVLVEDSHDCLIRSEGPLTAVLGIDDAVVVVTDDAVLVTSRHHAQDVKRVCERLKRERRREVLHHNRVYRPWGFYQTVHAGERFQVKRLTVHPGGKLSLQKHYHRSEHWVVVNGTALVTRDAETLVVRENESIYLPLGAVHRLENPGRLPLNLIEVQSGSYLGEDDIVRLEDTYGRIG